VETPNDTPRVEFIRIYKSRPRDLNGKEFQSSLPYYISDKS
jgi:hypothetical protein